MCATKLLHSPRRSRTNDVDATNDTPRTNDARRQHVAFAGNDAYANDAHAPYEWPETRRFTYAVLARS